MTPELTIRGGNVSPEELAAVTAVLLARTAAATAEPTETDLPTIAHWRRLERAPGFHAPHSWQAIA